MTIINLNLNSTSISEKNYGKKEKGKISRYEGKNWGKMIKRKHWGNSHYRGELKIVGEATDMHKCRICKRVLSAIAFTTANVRQDGCYYLMGSCRECGTTMRREQRAVRKLAPPQPKHCDMCHKHIDEITYHQNSCHKQSFQLDHLHGSTIFRGWLCSNCNSGIGKLGDDLSGVIQAAIYLEKDKDKIIETLNIVYDKMFARKR